MIKMDLKIGIIGDDELTLQCYEKLVQLKHHSITLINPFKKILTDQGNPEVISLQKIEDRIFQLDLIIVLLRSNSIPLDALVKTGIPIIIFLENSEQLQYPSHIPHSIITKQNEYQISWALLRAENIIDILTTQTISLEKDETAAQLNERCIQLAADSLPAVVALWQKQEPPIESGLKFKIYPSSLITGILNFEESAEKLESIFRALSFKNYDNPYALPKLLIADTFLIITSLKFIKTRSKDQARTIININAAGIEVATSLCHVLIESATTFSNEAIDLITFCQQHAITIGSKIPSTNQITQEIKNFLNHLPDEHLYKLYTPPTPSPYFNDNHPSKVNSKNVFFKKELREILSPAEMEKFKQAFPEHDLASFIIAIIYLYIYRLNDKDEPVIVGWNDTNKYQSPLLNKFYLSSLPLKAYVDKKSRFTDVLHDIKNEIEMLRSLHIPRDLFLRYSNLNEQAYFWPNDNLPININIADSFHSLNSSFNDCLDFFIERSSGKFAVEINTRYLNESDQAFMISNIQEHILQIAQYIITNVSNLLIEVPIFSSIDYEKTIINWNQLSIEYSKTLAAHHLFEEEVNKHPDRIAIIDGDRKLTYNQLNQAANKVAHFLLEKKYPIESRIAVIFNRSIELVITILGIVKAGYTYVPLDGKFPVERIQYITEHADTKLIFSNQFYIEKFKRSSFAGKIINFEDIDSEKNSNPNVKIEGKNLLYIIYTSGTTGQPKGVEIEHSAMVNLCLWYEKSHPLETRMNVGLTIGVSFDVSAGEIWQNLTTGSTLIVCDEETLVNPDKFFIWLDDNKINLTNLSTPLFEVLAKHNVQRCYKDLTVLTIGEKLQSYKPKWLHALYNQYGPTECTVLITEDDVLPVNQNHPFPPLIGRQVNNVQLYLLNQQLQPVPIGAIGCLYVAGACLARGYHSAPTLTEEKFIQLNINNQTIRCYNTGDYVRFLPNGKIDYLERRDAQVKIRGYRIELADIEANILRFPHVKHCATIVKTDGDLKYLVTYLTVTVDKKTFNLNELRIFLERALPSYMVPAIFIILDNLPFTPNYKIDRKLLAQANNFNHNKFENEEETEKTEIEKTLIEIYQFFFKSSQITYKSNLYHLNGDSIIAMQIAARINEKFGLNIYMSAIFEHPIIQDMAHFIERKINNDSSINKKKILVPYSADKFPIAPAQKKLFILWKIEPTNPYYNISSIYRLKGHIDIERLKNAYINIIKINESLRTNFLEDKQDIWQITHDIDKSVIDFSVINIKENEIAEACQQFIEIPFNLEHGSLIRLKLFQINDNDNILAICSHHIITDGWSINIFNREISSFYNQTSENMEPAKPLQYRDYTFWQQETLHEELLSQQLQYWKNLLKDTQDIQLPLDKPRANTSSHLGKTLFFEINAEIVVKLKRLAQQEETTLFNVLLTNYSFLLAKHTGQNDIVIGIPSAGRPNLEFENIIGFFANTLLFRSKISTEKNLIEHLSANKEQLMHSFQYQDIPFEEIVRGLKIDRDLSKNPIFQVMLGFEPLLQSTPEFEHIEAEHCQPPISYALFDQALFFEESSNGTILGRITFSTELFKEERMKFFVEELINVIEQGLQLPKTPIYQYQFLSKEEIKLLNKVNETETSHSIENSVIDLFEQQALLNPNQTAIIFKDQSISYYELNKLADKIAKHLLQVEKHSSNKSKIIVIVLDRNIELIVSILATAKAGLIYLPIDPQLPITRIQSILLDANPLLVLSTLELTHSLQSLNLELDFLTFEQISLMEIPDNPTNRTLLIKKPAYILYTSGSTGTPKGAIVSHLGLANCILYFQEKLSVSNKDQLLSLTSISFDIFQLEMYLPLVSGGTIVLSSSTSAHNIKEITSLLEQYPITIIQATPTFWKIFTTSEIKKYKQVKVICGGEALLPSLAYELIERFRELINVYGPTETTIWSTAYVFKDKNIDPLPIGRPIHNTKILILDKSRQKASIGVKGEILIGGLGLFLGYLNKPELTEKQLITIEDELYYKTGDIGYIGFDGQLYYIGRNDNQLKIRGHRVELGDIENNLAQMSFIKNISVLPRTNGATSLYCFLDINQEYILQENAGRLPELYAQWNKNWGKVWEKTYSNDTPIETENIDGWSSSIRKLPYTEKELNDLMSETARQILLLRPKNVLEIGCGSGMILHRIINNIEHYTGIDISQTAIDRLEHEILASKLSHKVKLCHLDAMQSEKIMHSGIDLVIINSVIQYFPSIEVLEEIITKIYQHCHKNVSIFLGDIPNIELNKSLYYLAACNKEELNGLRNVRNYIFNRIQNEEELFISPAYFLQSKKIKKLEYKAIICYRHLHQTTEMSLFRYSVILSPKNNLESLFNKIEYRQDCMSSIEEILSKGKALILKNIPNEQLRYITNKMQQDEPILIEQLPIQANPSAADMINAALAKGYDYLITPTDTVFNALNLYFSKEKQELINMVNVDFKESVKYNAPILNILRSDIIKQIKKFINKKLPSYMHPDHYILLQEMPTLVSGKIDRKFLSELTVKHSIPKNIHKGLTGEIFSIWTDLLGHSHFDINEEFLVAGGSSLSIILLAKKLQETYQCQISISDLFTEQTILKQAELIRKRQNKSEITGNCIATLKKSGAHTPLIFIHPLSGAIEWYKSLSQYINLDRPCFALSDPDLDTKQSRFTTFQEMAAWHAEQIRALINDQPCIIAGASFGGNLAVEIALQLQASNQVESILMFDSWAVIPKIFRNKNNFMQHTYDQYTKRINENENANIRIDELNSWFELQYQRTLMLLDYQLPSQLNLNIYLFKARDYNLLGHQAANNDWDFYGAAIETILVPGSHESIFEEPNIQQLAKEVDKVLKDLD